MRIHVCDDPEKHVFERGDCFELTVTPAAVDVLLERGRQDTQWGGPEHDDNHEPTDWLRFIHRQEERAKDLDTWPRRISATYRERLVKIAALAIAAIESYDRMEKRRANVTPVVDPCFL